MNVDEIVQAFWQQKGFCNEDVVGSSPTGGALCFLASNLDDHSKMSGLLIKLTHD